MGNTFSKTALILFARNPVEDAYLKKLAPGFGNNIQQKIFRKLNSQTRRILFKTRLPVFHFTTSNQVGVDFSERLFNAFSSVFKLGYENVIALGNDCPQLSAGILVAAQDILEKESAVFGPDARGGVYLLGFSKGIFSQIQTFSFIRWNTNQVLADLNQAFNLNVHSEFALPVLQDINNSLDFQECLQKIHFRLSLLLYFKALLTRIGKLPTINQESSYFLQLSSGLYFRGPPVSLS